MGALTRMSSKNVHHTKPTWHSLQHSLTCLVFCFYYLTGAPRAPGPVLKTYLVAYNVLSKLGWAYILYLAGQHLAGHSNVSAAANAVAATGINKTVLKVRLVTDDVCSRMAADAVVCSASLVWSNLSSHESSMLPEYTRDFGPLLR